MSAATQTTLSHSDCNLVKQRNIILTELSKDPFYSESAFNIANSNKLHRDLYQELFLHLCELPAEKLIDIFNKGYMRFYSIRFFTNQYKSDRSPFYNLYKRQKPQNIIGDFFEQELHNLYGDSNFNDFGIFEETKKEKQIQIIESTLDSLPWYDRELWRFRAENGFSYRHIFEQTKIPRSSITDTCLKVERLIKKNLGEAGLL